MRHGLDAKNSLRTPFAVLCTMMLSDNILGVSILIQGDKYMSDIDKEMLRKKRAQSIAKQDISTWEALIGAAGQPNIQKFIIIPRLYNFARAGLNISHPALDREEQILHSYMNNDGANSIHDFIKFIDGRIDINKARDIQSSLTEFLKAA